MTPHEQEPPAVTIELLPLGKKIVVPRNASLQDYLFDHGLEFPCGGRGKCKGCRVRVIEGALPATTDDERLLTRSELSDHWRLACRARATDNLKLELAQWEMSILTDNTNFHFEPQPGLGIAIDVGTTTIAAQLLDLTSGHVLSVRTELNAQAKFGADIMSRIDAAVHANAGPTLQRAIRQQLGAVVSELLREVGTRAAELKAVVLVGNTVMHHLFCGICVDPLAHHPFEPVDCNLKSFSGAELGWPLPSSAVVQFLPCLAGFVGSDILAGILATNIHRSDDLVALVDLGTNGEIVVGNRHRLVCASTAAGPAFEGARISRGMRATTGAVSAVTLQNGRLHCRILGNTAPRGICGSGLVDAVAAGLELGVIQSSGRIANGSPFVIADPVSLIQSDVRELQLAKGAIAAGLRILIQRLNHSLEEIQRVYLAGAFGNYLNRASARRIGLLPFPSEKVESAGNTALLGAKLALFNSNRLAGFTKDIRQRTEHISLNEHEQFQEIFADELQFPTC